LGSNLGVTARDKNPNPPYVQYTQQCPGKKWRHFACPFGAFRSGIILISEKMGKS
jgi:hypothetical protein